MSLVQALSQSSGQQLQRSQGARSAQIPGLRSNRLLFYLQNCFKPKLSDALFFLSASGRERFGDFRRIQELFMRIFRAERRGADAPRSPPATGALVEAYKSQIMSEFRPLHQVAAGPVAVPQIECHEESANDDLHRQDLSAAPAVAGASGAEAVASGSAGQRR